MSELADGDVAAVGVGVSTTALTITFPTRNAPAGGEDSPYSLLPQHSPLPSFRNPQVWLVPAMTDAKVPSGGEDSPDSLLPQHSMVPSVRNPQVWLSPALIDANAPFSGEDCPQSLPPPALDGSVRPQPAGVDTPRSDGCKRS